MSALKPYAVTWWFGLEEPTNHDLGMMSWRIVKARSCREAWQVALGADDIVSYEKSRVLALVFKGNRAPKRASDYIAGYWLNLSIEKETGQLVN